MKRWHAAGIALAVIALAAGIDRYPLLDPDEGRNAEVAREMAASNDYTLPTLNGLPYLDKPPVYFAAAALMMELLGPTELAARLPALLFTLATLGVLAWWARRWWGAQGTLVTVMATAASPLTLGFARTTIFDSALTFFVVVALLSFHEAVERQNGRWSALAWAAIGFGVLTKGPIALVVPLLVVLPYAWRRAALRTVWQPVGPLLFLAIVLPWVVAVTRRVPDFVEYALVTESWLRLTTGRLERTEPFWYFFPILFAGALPWTLVVLAARQRLRPLDDQLAFLLLWVAIPFVFFTLSQSKRPQYVLPLIPAVALIVARLWRDAREVPGAAGIALTLAAMGVFLAAGHPLIPRWVPTTPDIRSAIPVTAVTLGLACVVAAVITWFARRRPTTALLGLALPVLTIPFASGRLMQAIGRERSAADIARAVSSVVSEQDRVLAIETFPLSLAFYLRRPLLLASDDARELTSNYLRGHDAWIRAPGSPVRPAEWWREALAECRARVFVVGAADHERRQVLSARLPLLIETKRYAAYGPCGGSDLARTGNAMSDIPARTSDIGHRPSSFLRIPRSPA